MAYYRECFCYPVDAYLVFQLIQQFFLGLA